MKKWANIAGLARTAAAGVALLLAAAPAPASAASGSQNRAALSVSAIVAPSCRIDSGSAAHPAIACSSGTSFSTATVARRDEQPLSDAAAILGAPARGPRGIEFAAPLSPAASTGATGASTRYLTVTY